MSSRAVGIRKLLAPFQPIRESMFHGFGADVLPMEECFSAWMS